MKAGPEDKAAAERIMAGWRAEVKKLKSGGSSRGNKWPGYLRGYGPITGYLDGERETKE